MAKKESWYAVELQNGTKSIVNSWEACQKIIKTCPSNARYKKFSTMDDAENFLGKKITKETKANTNVSLPFSDRAIAYVDGSYNASKHTWGYGVVLFPEGQEGNAKEYFGEGTRYNTARNVAGEIYGAIKAAKTAADMGFSEILIHYDYQGVAAWATGDWKAKQELTKFYKQTMDELSKKINITFNKVAAHTGVKYNERADQLAKIAAGIK